CTPSVVTATVGRPANRSAPSQVGETGAAGRVTRRSFGHSRCPAERARYGAGEAEALQCAVAPPVVTTALTVILSPGAKVTVVRIGPHVEVPAMVQVVLIVTPEPSCTAAFFTIVKVAVMLPEAWTV